ncbi:MAG TPA: HAMP domain-containing sensor histidine kinase [Puia sp.]|uniref:sensor histidine kinase n=1 Tax=Puia sp. TaxID=2045100 RepID=UPI002C1F5B97|nr:HAMP domain-containing sensor histidine kinase [Puia sp.]HVU94103.1 HAMP domain-containing sensor histidine kinase [Puia sp.]
MKIRVKLTLLFAGLFGILLLAFALTLYLTTAAHREADYFQRLRQLAITKANLLVDAGVPPATLELIYKNSLTTLPQEEVAVFDTAFHLLYHDIGDIDKLRETQGMIDSIIAFKEIHFYYEDLQVTGFLYSHHGKKYVITAAARDEEGLARLHTLGLELILGFAIAIGLTLLAGIFFARKALQPVSAMVDHLAAISANRMDLRLSEGNRKDEIATLALTFNHMLDRLEQSFEAQKQFVGNISHELRTPLAAIIAEAEVSAIRSRSPEEYRETLRLILQDAQRLSRLSTDLLDLAKTAYDPSGIQFSTVRPDEVLLDARKAILQANPGYRVLLHFEKEMEDSDCITVNGNEYLLRVAFSNLIENSCKFSPGKQCHVHICFGKESLSLEFRDDGIGIPPEDLGNIFTPFFRGANKRYAPGNGIGLSLTQRIVTLHHGTLAVTSRPGNGTVFTISLPQT